MKYERLVETLAERVLGSGIDTNDDEAVWEFLLRDADAKAYMDTADDGGDDIDPGEEFLTDIMEKLGNI